MKKGLKKFIAASALSVLLVPSALAYATPPSKTTVYFNSTSNRYEDCVMVSGSSAYAWSDSYLDSGVTTVKAYALPSEGTWTDDYGRYWAEAQSYGGNSSGRARSEAHLPSGTFAQHERKMPFNSEFFYNARY
ncbi:hypothetical protein [Clostridium sp. 'White wine YQ']|uniref:hypothetical protein n=1 Tax=Clostridium sp. 'White wine YQ' TaxID=3027474 RepID=UPI00236649E3|nr:hypothetical protein [Clostridium sp. 'White wine YQ']MDD7795916.1 hypothetical protein [Clostridium sp. 'White wine YQ']